MGDTSEKLGDHGKRYVIKAQFSHRLTRTHTISLSLSICPIEQHYVSEVKGVEQVLDEMENIAKAEFEKLEKKLQQ